MGVPVISIKLCMCVVLSLCVVESLCYSYNIFYRLCIVSVSVLYLCIVYILHVHLCVHCCFNDDDFNTIFRLMYNETKLISEKPSVFTHFILFFSSV